MHTRVDDNTVFRRGKSDIPASRMEIELSSRESELRSEATEEERELRAWDCVGWRDW